MNEIMFPLSQIIPVHPDFSNHGNQTGRLPCSHLEFTVQPVLRHICDCHSILPEASQDKPIRRARTPERREMLSTIVIGWVNAALIVHFVWKVVIPLTSTPTTCWAGYHIIPVFPIIGVWFLNGRYFSILPASLDALVGVFVEIREVLKELSFLLCYIIRIPCGKLFSQSSESCSMKLVLVRLEVWSKPKSTWILRS